MNKDYVYVVKKLRTDIVRYYKSIHEVNAGKYFKQDMDYKFYTSILEGARDGDGVDTSDALQIIRCSNVSGYLGVENIAKINDMIMSGDRELLDLGITMLSGLIKNKKDAAK